MTPKYFKPPYFWATVCKTVRPMLSDRRPVLSVCNVSVLWPNGGWIKMKLGTKVRLGPSHIVLDGDPATHKWAQPAPQFSAHVCCGQTAGWIKMPLCTKVVLGPTTLCQTQLSPAKKGGTAPAPSFRPMSILAKRSSISATAEHLSTFCVAFQFHIFITG